MKMFLIKDLHPAKCRQKLLLLMAFFVGFMLVITLHRFSPRFMKFGHWTLENPSLIKYPPLIESTNQNTYLFSAIIPFHQSDPSHPVATVTLFDATYGTEICCVLDKKHNLTVSDAIFIRQFQYKGVFNNLLSYMTRSGVPYPARQLECKVKPNAATHLSIASESCSQDINQYKPILKPRGDEGKLGICAKIAYNEGLKQERLVEWMEFQKMMGVDRVVVYTLDISEKVWEVFNLYSDFVITVPYQLPGKIIRSMRAGNRSFPQFSHDEQVAVFDCKERLSGFSHVAGIDFDEFLYPRSNQTLKEFLQTTLAQSHPGAGAFYFHQQFHITDWDPSHPSQPLTTLMYQQSAPPRWECQKFIYIPQRTLFGQTHWVYVKPEYSTVKIDPSIAVIHHYRACPQSWKHCHGLSRIMDPDMTRYGTPLAKRVKAMMGRLKRRNNS